MSKVQNVESNSNKDSFKRSNSVELYSNSTFSFSKNLEKALKLLRQMKTDVEMIHLKEDEFDALFEKVIVHPTEEEKRSNTYLKTIQTLNDLGFQIEGEFKSITNNHLLKSGPKYTSEKKIFDFENLKDCLMKEVEDQNFATLEQYMESIENENTHIDIDDSESSETVDSANNLIFKNIQTLDSDIIEMADFDMFTGYDMNDKKNRLDILCSDYIEIMEPEENSSTTSSKNMLNNVISKADNELTPLPIQLTTLSDSNMDEEMNKKVWAPNPTFRLITNEQILDSLIGNANIDNTIFPDTMIPANEIDSVFDVGINVEDVETTCHLNEDNKKIEYLYNDSLITPCVGEAAVEHEDEILLLNLHCPKEEIKQENVDEEKTPLIELKSVKKDIDENQLMTPTRLETIGTNNNSRNLSTKCAKVLVIERGSPKLTPTKRCEKVKYPDLKLNEENSLKTLANCDPQELEDQSFPLKTSENGLNNNKTGRVDIQAIRDMMQRTFKIRRPKLVTCHTIEIVKKYPNFSYIDVVKDEFNRINTGHNIGKLEKELYRRFDKILEHNQKKSMLLTTILDKYNKDVNNEHTKKTAVVMALITYFCSTTEALLNFCPIMEDEPVPNAFLTPKMIIIGDLVGGCKIKVYTDNILVLEPQDVYDGLLAVYCLYYIFDISYDTSVVNLMEYFDFLSDQEQVSVYIDPFLENKVDVK